MRNPRAHDRSPDATTASSLFATTHWSVVFEAARPDAPGGLDAFAQLYRDYWFPLYAYVRRRGRPPHEAEDWIEMVSA